MKKVITRTSTAFWDFLSHFNILRLNPWLPLNALSTNQHEKTEIQNPTSVQQRVKTTPSVHANTGIVQKAVH